MLSNPTLIPHRQDVPIMTDHAEEFCHSALARESPLFNCLSPLSHESIEYHLGDYIQVSNNDTSTSFSGFGRIIAFFKKEISGSTFALIECYLGRSQLTKELQELVESGKPELFATNLMEEITPDQIISHIRVASSERYPPHLFSFPSFPYPPFFFLT